MRKIKLKNQTTESFPVDDPDIPEFNKQLLKHKFEDLDSFEVYSKGKNVKVDLINGDVIIDGQTYDLEIDEFIKNKLKNLTLKWVNFRRVTISQRMGGGQKSRQTAYGIGFQTNIDGKSFKRITLVDREKIKLLKE